MSVRKCYSHALRAVAVRRATSGIMAIVSMWQLKRRSLSNTGTVIFVVVSEPVVYYFWVVFIACCAWLFSEVLKHLSRALWSR